MAMFPSVSFALARYRREPVYGQHKVNNGSKNHLW